MQELFRVRCQPDDYRCLTNRAEDEGLFELLTTGQVVGERWTASSVISVDDDPSDAGFPDFPPFAFHFLIATESAWKRIFGLVGDFVEALPVRHSSGRSLFVLNITRVIDCLVPDLCETNRLAEDPSGYFSSIYRYSFNLEALSEQHLFRCPQMKAFEIYASSEFKSLIEREKLTGLKFSRIHPPKP